MQAQVGTYLANGFVDFVSTQTAIGGEKGFTTALHYGAASLPTGSAFGASVGTVFALKGSVGDITEANFQSFGGLVVKTVYNAGNGNNITKLVATGSDTGTVDSGGFEFYGRDDQSGTNWVLLFKADVTAGEGKLNIGNAANVVGATLNNEVYGFPGQQNSYTMYSQNNASQTLVLAEDGSPTAFIQSGAPGWQTPSDVRLKKNVKELTVLDKLRSLRGVSYDMKSSGVGRIGVIAQEVEKVFPYAVSSTDKLKGVSYDAIAAIALQATKELKVENDKLKQRLAKLEAGIRPINPK
jgi:hypothetical protein